MMDTVRTFFEKTDEDTVQYFEDKHIWQAGEKYQGYQGKYPVIYFLLKTHIRQTGKKCIRACALR